MPDATPRVWWDPSVRSLLVWSPAGQRRVVLEQWAPAEGAPEQLRGDGECVELVPAEAPR